MVLLTANFTTSIFSRISNYFILFYFIKDYIKIQYAKGDVLYVPVTQLDLVSKYIGSQDSGSLKLNKLGGQEWQKTRTRVRAAVRDMAKQLTALYAKRLAV